MLKSRSGQTAPRIILGLAAFWLVNPKELEAQSAPMSPRVLVVVADSSDAECMKRVGGEYVHVELLLSPEVGAMPRNYQAFDERVRDLRKFRLFVYRSDMYCPSKCFWRDRIAAANPHGVVHRLWGSRRSAVTDYERRAQQASEMHGALATILPEHQASLNAKLKVELQRLNSLRLHSHQLASGE